MTRWMLSVPRIFAPPTRSCRALTKYLDIFFHHLIGFALIMLMLPAGLSVLFIMLFPTAQAGGSLWVTDPAYLGVAATQTSNWNQYLTPAQNASDIMTQIVAT